MIGGASCIGCCYPWRLTPSVTFSTKWGHQTPTGAVCGLSCSAYLAALDRLATRLRLAEIRVCTVVEQLPPVTVFTERATQLRSVSAARADHIGVQPRVPRVMLLS